MKRITLLLTCLLSLPQLTLSQKPTGRNDDSGSNDASVAEALKKVDRELDEASERGDKTVFQRVLADEMISVAPEGTISKKAEILAGVRPPKPGTRLSIIAADIEVHSFGDAAIISSNKTSKWEWSKGSSSDTYRETNTYLLRNRQWLLIASQQSHAPPPYTAKDVQLTVMADEQRIRGNKQAAVVLIEFADYQCPYCRQFAAQTMKQIEHDYIDTGRVGFVFHDFPIESSHPYAFKAAVAAQCAGDQGRLWEMNHKLLADPEPLTPDQLLVDAAALDLDMSKFRQCLADEKASAAVRQRMREAAALGIDGTPMFIVGIRKPGSNSISGLRMIEGGYSYDVFKATIETLIAAHE